MRAGFADRTIRMLLDTEEEIFEFAMGKNHPYRTLARQINFKKLLKPIRKHYSDKGQTGYSVDQGFKAMLVQFWEDLSDREMERALRENLIFKWFCGFGLKDQTPDHSYFGRLRQRIGTERVAKVFNQINNQLNARGLYGEAFTFMDASKVISKVALWEERDRAIRDGYEKLNNQVVGKYAKDKQARWGAKSKKDIWFGFKRHVAVDMRYGLISKTTITPANVPDYKVVKKICPKQGMVFADKLYDTKGTDRQIRASGCYPATIRKKNNRIKIKELDKWRSQVRMPFEGVFSKLPRRARYRGFVFSKLPRRARYRGLVKVMLQNYMESMVYNLKKATKILGSSPPLIQTKCVYLGNNDAKNKLKKNQISIIGKDI
jgi:IS5 family transposase